MNIHRQTRLKVNLFVFILILIIALSYTSDIHIKLRFHTTIDLFNILFLMGIIYLGWQRRRTPQSHYWIILCFGALNIILHTLLHFFVFMNTLKFGVKYPEQLGLFWVTARMFDGLTIFLSVTLSQTKRRSFYISGILGPFLLAIASATVILFHHIPQKFASINLPLDVIYYLILGFNSILLITLILFKVRKSHPYNRLDLLTAFMLIILGELVILWSRSRDDYYNSIAHFSVFLAYFMYYRGVLNIRNDSIIGSVNKTNDVGMVSKEIDFKTAIDTSYNGILLTDERGQITYVNQAVKNMYTVNVGQSLWDILDDSIGDIIRRELEQSRHFIGEIKLPLNMKALVSLYPFMTKDCMKGYMCILLDVSNERFIDQELLQAKNQAEQSNQAKSNFLAHMSHEIRTPLNGITGFIQLLEETTLTAEQSDFVHNIKVSTDTLLQIVNDILDLSKIEAGKMELHPVPFNFRLVVHRGVNIYQAKAKDKNLRLEIEIDDAIPPFLKGDTTRLKQILMNLTNNAIKFTEQGSIKVKMRQLANHRIEFSIEDTGIGLSEEAREQILQPYIQSHDDRKYGGTGLGLAICKSFIELMGGTLTVDSELGKGTTFRFTLPFEPVRPEEVFEFVQKKNLFEPSKRYPGAKVLLVEDDEVNKKLFMLLIESKGIACDLAENGQEAIKKWHENEYDLIFMDCQMPILDGYEATRRIRRLEGDDKHTVIVALTASAMKGDAERCFAAGMDDYVSKPIQLAELMRILDKYLVASIEVNPHQEIIQIHT